MHITPRHLRNYPVESIPKKSIACLSTGKKIQSIQMNADLLRVLLAGMLVVMILPATNPLRRLPLTFSQSMIGGLIALLIPAPGPFLVIPLRPGKPVQRKNNKLSGGEI